MVSLAEASRSELTLGASEHLTVLGKEDASLAELMSALSALDRQSDNWRTVKVGIASNVTVDLWSSYLRRYGYLTGVRLEVHKGTFDDVVGDLKAHRANGIDLILILPFFDNLQPGWEAQLGNLDAAARQAVLDDYLLRLRLALQANGDNGQVLVFGAHIREPSALQNEAVRLCLAAFNDGLRRCVADYSVARFIDTESLIQGLGAQHCLAARFYFRAKAPYTPLFLNALSRRVCQATRQFGSRFHKVLVLDCDNTLWGGVVGEDGTEGIKLDAHSFPGNIFRQVQQQFQTLEAQGVLLCLCSKNNDADVAEAFQRAPMVLQDKQIVARRVNWNDKPANLRELATELNLGLDSFVFVDDSDFEVQAVREQLPEVTVFQVPKELHHYPALVREEITPLFLAGGVVAESLSKTQQYQMRAEAAKLQAAFATQEDYLRSLQLCVHLQRNARIRAPRIAELMAKSNQFNLTTQRLGLGNVLALMDDPASVVYCFSVRDRLTDHGLTGVLITQDTGDAVQVHSFLMSCRVIGRGIEFSVWKSVASDALARGKRRLQASYLPTAKNALVADFYDRLGLQRTGQTPEGGVLYETQLGAGGFAGNDWVEIQDD